MLKEGSDQRRVRSHLSRFQQEIGHGLPDYCLREQWLQRGRAAVLLFACFSVVIGAILPISSGASRSSSVPGHFSGLSLSLFAPYVAQGGSYRAQADHAHWIQPQMQAESQDKK